MMNKADADKARMAASFACKVYNSVSRLYDHMKSGATA